MQPLPFNPFLHVQRCSAEQVIGEGSVASAGPLPFRRMQRGCLTRRGQGTARSLGPSLHVDATRRGAPGSRPVVAPGDAENAEDVAEGRHLGRAGDTGRVAGVNQVDARRRTAGPGRWTSGTSGYSRASPGQPNPAEGSDSGGWGVTRPSLMRPSSLSLTAKHCLTVPRADAPWRQWRQLAKTQRLC